jgi:hypothetical protein
MTELLQLLSPSHSVTFEGEPTIWCKGSDRIGLIYVDDKEVDLGKVYPHTPATEWVDIPGTKLEIRMSDHGTVYVRRRVDEH